MRRVELDVFHVRADFIQRVSPTDNRMLARLNKVRASLNNENFEGGRLSGGVFLIDVIVISSSEITL